MQLAAIIIAVGTTTGFLLTMSLLMREDIKYAIQKLRSRRGRG